MLRAAQARQWRVPRVAFQTGAHRHFATDYARRARVTRRRHSRLMRRALMLPPRRKIDAAPMPHSIDAARAMRRRAAFI